MTVSDLEKAKHLIFLERGQPSRQKIQSVHTTRVESAIWSETLLLTMNHHAKNSTVSSCTDSQEDYSKQPKWNEESFSFLEGEGEEKNYQLSDGYQGDDCSDTELTLEGNAQDETFRFQTLALASDATDSTCLRNLESCHDMSI